MSNRLLKGGREPMKQKERSKAKKPLQDTLKLGDKLKELQNRKNAKMNLALQEFVNTIPKASTVI